MAKSNEPAVAWVFGGSKGIGLAIAEALGREGYAVAISARDEKGLDTAERQLASTKGKVQSIVCDISDEVDVGSAYQAVVKRVGVPTLLVNSAGISPWSTFSECSVEEFDLAIAINLRGLFLSSRAVLPAMYERGSGAIVNVLSVASTKGYKNGAAYVASKFGALGMANAMREEARKHGVRVINVLPGAVETELWGKEERAQFHDKMMQPSDIGALVVAALTLPERAVVEEILVRPMIGDL